METNGFIHAKIYFAIYIILLVTGLILITAGALLSSSHFFIFFFFIPIIVGGSINTYMLLGIIFIISSFFVFTITSFFTGLPTLNTKEIDKKSSINGMIMIGPLPIFFSNSSTFYRYKYIFIIIAILLMITYLLLIFV